MARVFVEPIGVTVDVDEDETLLAPLRDAGIAVAGTCAGRGTCGKCVVRLGMGELSPPTETELRRLSPQLLADGWRLACAAKPLSARLSIEVRQTGGRRQILTTSDLRRGKPRPAVRIVMVTVDQPQSCDLRADVQRFRDAVGGAEVPFALLRRLTDLLHECNWSVAATLYENRVIDVCACDATKTPYGLAVDIGTSKIIAYLFDLESGRLIDHEALENPQMRYGEDVVSRLALARDLERRDELAATVRGGINTCAARLRERWSLDVEQILDMTVVANTAMHHLALGVSPRSLSASPFAPAVAVPLTVAASELGIDMHPRGGVHWPPPIAGFVGSDALAVIAATRLASKRRPAMAIDIGTNTEVAVAHGGRVSVTSCASGPAFEGYQIRHGMKAVDGAIERVTVGADGSIVDFATIGNLAPVGLCGSGVVDLLADLVRSGVVTASGRFAEHPLVRRGSEGTEYVVTRGPRGEIVLSQQDIRALQLAKGAIHAGWELLLDALGLTVADLHRVFVAGAFGNYLDLDASQLLGLFPPVARERVSFVGNAAGVGAEMALIDVRARRRMAALRRRTEFLDLATNARFHEVFAARLGFASTA